MLALASRPDPEISPNGAIVLVYYDENLLYFVGNFVCHARRIVDPDGRPFRHFALVARSESAAEALVRLDPSVRPHIFVAEEILRTPTSVWGPWVKRLPRLEASRGWGSMPFRAMSCVRDMLTPPIVELGISVLFLDADQLVVRDPFTHPTFRRVARAVDIAYACDRPLGYPGCSADTSPDECLNVQSWWCPVLNSGTYFAAARRPRVIARVMTAITVTCLGLGRDVLFQVLGVNESVGPLANASPPRTLREGRDALWGQHMG
ncbi:hypothetical protein D6833_01010, partial [Candidatus Parcubacteria bacterium]